MRLFIAINFNNDTRSRLIGLCEQLRLKAARGRFSLPENLHLTLAFLGECDAKNTADAKAALNSTSFFPIDIVIDRVGRFKRDDSRKTESGEIWWAGVRENKQLSALQSELIERLTFVGFSLDKRKYSPHITLAREVVTEQSPWQIESFGERVGQIDLMKSERIGGKLVYTSIFRR